MTRIKVEGIHCGKCVERIENAFKEAKLKYEVIFEKKEVIVNGNDADVKLALEELDDLGFEGEIIE